MTQFDFGTIDPATKSGGALASDLMGQRDALHTNHLGATRPTYVKPGMLWLKQVSASQWILYLYCDLGDIQLASIDPSLGVWDITARDLTLTAIPSGPSVDPSNDDDFARKKYVDDKVAAFIGAGTQMLFVQTAAPAGWTKVTAHNDKALRVVSGAAGSGGSVAFTTAFTSRTLSGSVDNTTLSAAQMPYHQHTQRVALRDYFASGNSSNWPLNMIIGEESEVSTTGGAGGSQPHNHPLTLNNLDMSVSYVDAIIASKN